MARLLELDSEEHRSLAVPPGLAVRFAATQHILPLKAIEIGKAASSMPVFLNRNVHTGAWALSAMTSFDAGTNLFAVDGTWRATHKPLFLETYPLFLMQSPRDTNGFVLGIEEGAVDSAVEGDRLFDDAGKPSLHLLRIKSLLEAGIDQDMQTMTFADSLDKRGLLQEIGINVEYEDGEMQTITGLHTIREDALQAMPADQLGELNKRGYLVFMHAMLLSLFQLNHLIRRHNAQPGSRAVDQVKVEVAKDLTSANVLG